MKTKKNNYEEIDVNKIKNLTVIKLKQIGEQIMKLRINNDMTQQELAFLIYSDKSLISNLERGTAKNITLQTLIKITELFNTELKSLI